MTSGRMLSSFRKNPNLCETSTEYPSLKQSLTPRHLCTCVKSKTSDSIGFDISSNKITNQSHDHQHKDSSKDSEKAREQTELIKLFDCEKQEEINNKLYKKRRYEYIRTTGNADNDKQDNTN